jgi:hypothetical protein
VKAIVPAAVIGAALLAGATAPAPVAAKGATLSIPLAAVPPSTESGTAVAMRTRGIVTVTIGVTGERAISRQPAHIHHGTCGSSGPIIISLKDVTHGKSVTQIPVATWMSATKSGPLYINVHKSNMDFNTILACGAIAAPQTVF